MSSPATQKTVDPDGGAPLVSPLIVQLIQASLSHTHQVTDTLIELLQAQLADRDAELAAVRNGVQTAFDGPYMPRPATVLAALYPNRDRIDLFRRAEES